MSFLFPEAKRRSNFGCLLPGAIDEQAKQTLPSASSLLCFNHAVNLQHEMNDWISSSNQTHRLAFRAH